MSEDVWWPSRYGAADEIGALNEITPAKVVSAARLVKTGQMFDLGQVLESGIPAFPGRTFTQHLTTTAHQVNGRRADAGPLGGWGESDMNWIMEVVSSTSQMGTHLDGLNHIQIGERFYNGHTLDEIVENDGTNRLGIETVPQIITRGLLVDVAAGRGVGRLAAGDVITPDEVEAALSAAGLVVSAGDAVLVHTGWGQQWMTDNAGYLLGEPGPGMALAAWLADKRVALTGCDTWSYGPVPAENPARPFEVPQWLNVRQGVFVLENLKLADLATAGVREFMLVVTHARVKGATGAWVSPVAVV